MILASEDTEVRVSMRFVAKIQGPWILVEAIPLPVKATQLPSPNSVIR